MRENDALSLFNRFLGYTKDADGNLIIDPSQSETVKRIYRDYLDGASIDARLDGLQQELSQTVKSYEAYEAIVDEIYRLRDEKEHTCVNMAKRDEQKRRVAELRVFIMSQSNKTITFDKGLVKRVVSSITVFADSFMVKFKSGVIVDIIGKIITLRSRLANITAFLT